MKVSVVLATYNGAKFLKEQLESLATQTLLPDELIISDDGSCDETLAIAHEFRARSPFPVEIYQNPHRLGYAENFLLASTRAKGTFVAFCDQDDLWYPAKLERCVDRLEKSGSVMCAHSVDFIDAESNVIGFYSQRFVDSALFGRNERDPWNLIVGMSLVFRRQILDIIPYSERGRSFHRDESLAHDGWVYFLACTFGEIAVIGDALAGYRQHGDNSSGKKKRSIVELLFEPLNISLPSVRRRMSVAQWRADFLRRKAKELADPTQAECAAVGAAYWAHISTCEALRVELFASERLIRRASVFSRLVGLGCYRAPDQGGLGRRILVKDLLVGLARAGNLTA